MAGNVPGAQAPMRPIFTRLQLRGWQQFEDVDVDFHPNVTILTGANASGKSTLLRIVAKAMRLSFRPSLATPRKKAKGGPNLYDIPLRSSPSERFDSGLPQRRVGTIYASNNAAEITVPALGTNIAYELNVAATAVAGFLVPSHFPELQYAQLGQMGFQPPTTGDAFQGVYYKLVQGQGGELTTQLKDHIIRLGVFAYDSPAVVGDPTSRELFEGFQEILRVVLPKEFGFQRFSIRLPEVIVETASGQFPIDALSGGIAKCMSIAWLAYMKSHEVGHRRFCILLDEPENHLHPRLQRIILPNLQAAFPEAQFIVATHSPLIIGSVRTSYVYVLSQAPESTLTITQKLDMESKSGSPEDVLRRVLDVPIPQPVWVEEEIRNVLRDLSRQHPSREALDEIHGRLRAAGLEEWLDEIILRLGRGEGGE